MLRHVIPRLPRKMGTYGEFMVGAGAVFIELARLNRFESAVISDSNAELMNSWRMVKDHVDELIAELRRPQYVYERSVYLQFREMVPARLSKVEAAARFIYLNRTCFNGLYRVNASGQFNVPFGKYTDPVICDESNLRAVSAILKNVRVMTVNVLDAGGDNSDPTNPFPSALGGFVTYPHPRGKLVNGVYIDPPYIPISKTSSFVNYTEGRFSMDDHVLLGARMAELARSGVRVVTSNSSAPAAVEILKDFDIDFVTGGRSVAGGSGDRKSVQEIVAFAGPRS
jgi:DNA adenine methylase